MEALTYRIDGDYRVPNLSLPEEPPVVLGKYALLRKQYLKQHRRILFVNMLTDGTLNQHLMEIEQMAMSRLEQLTAQRASAEGVTEQMKSADQMKWVGMMNNIRQSAEEMILSDLIYS